MRLKGGSLVVMLLVSACAQVRTITGGEQDKTPPTLVAASPTNGSTHFTSNLIRLEFDERVQLDRVRDKLLISPPLETLPVVKVSGPRSVDITLNDELKPNTTYTFNLGGAVKDLTEGNPAADLTYVLSTGDALDSLQLLGTVVNAFGDVPEKEILVMLYDAMDTSSFRAARPAYMTRANALGEFAIANLPSATFQVFALRDKNANYRYDLPNEEVAFLDSTITLSGEDSLVPLIELRAFLPNSPIQSVRSVKVIADGALQVILARATDSLSIRDIARTGGSLHWQQEWNPTRDTALFWPSDTTLLQSGSYVLSEGNTAVDTVRYRPLQRMPYNTGITATQIHDASGTRVELRAARPVAAFDTTRFSMLSDSLDLPFTLERSGDPRILILTTPLRPGGSASLTLLPKSIRDIYGGVNDTVRVSLGRAAENSLGSLRVELKDLVPDGQYLLQLLDAQQRVVQEAPTSATTQTVRWEGLPPGARTLRLIEDANNNGRWDTGDLDQRLQPERTWYHPEPVNIRAAWDIVVEWDLTAAPSTE